MLNPTTLYSRAVAATTWGALTWAAEGAGLCEMCYGLCDTEAKLCEDCKAEQEREDRDYREAQAAQREIDDARYRNRIRGGY